VIEIFENGNVIPFENPPPQYEEENNKSALKNMEFVRKTVFEMKKSVVVKFVDKKPFVSPHSRWVKNRTKRHQKTTSLLGRLPMRQPIPGTN
jgi:hypothetical protein